MKTTQPLIEVPTSDSTLANLDTMNLPEKFRTDVEAFPPALRALLDAELAAGNEIAEIGHTFPAPPVGAYVKLARPVTTRPRQSGSGLDFFDRNGSSYSGEFTNENRLF